MYSARRDATEAMLALCAADLLPMRPGRSEREYSSAAPNPAKKLTRPRHLMTNSPSRDNKGKPRKCPTPLPSTN